MARTTKRTLALLLVLVQLITLLPVLSLRAEAAEPASDAASPQESALPVLNETIVGTVKFQSFNFLGDNATGSDGVDYTSTFYYSDDFFSPSAIHETASTSLKWSDLSATETALASVSFDLTVATYASNENNVLRDHAHVGQHGLSRQGQERAQSARAVRIYEHRELRHL